MKNALLIISLFIISSSFAQVKKLDKLEVYYAQKHYKMVYRKATRLLEKPDYDYSYQPEFYKSIAILQLSDKSFWMQTHPGALQEARKLFLEVKASPEGMKVFNAHLDQIQELRKVLVERVAKLAKDPEEKERYDELQQILFGLFDHLPELDNPSGVKPDISPDVEAITESKFTLKTRDNVHELAKKQLGVPYVWAGESPSGFDCSGFTSYVFSQLKTDIPRRAVDQYNAATKVKQRNVQKGDLVFFNNGEGVSHVGIVISEKGAPLTMIHASSSQGIVVTNIEDTEYWQKRLHGFGTFINKVSEK